MSLARPLALLTFLACLLAAAAARADDASTDPLYGCGKAKGQLSVSLKPDLELKDLVTWAMGFSCKKFIYASAIASRSAKVTIMTPGTMSAREAWSLFETSLSQMGLALVPKGAMLTIVEDATAQNEAIAILKDFPDGGADVVRLVLRPEHVGVDDLKGALDLVRSPHGVVSPLENLHAILITDDSAHIERMKTLVDELDRPAGTGDGVYAIPLQHVDAGQLADTIQKLVGDGKTPLRLVADDHTNALFFSGSASDYLRVRSIAHAIDIDTGDSAELHVLPLHHLRAKDVADAITPLAPQGVKIAADEPSNSLLALASARDAASLRDLVAKMDVPRKQVYIEALVLEVEANTTREVGTAWHLGKNYQSSGNTWLGSQGGDGLTTVIPKDSLGSTTDATGFLGGVLGVPLDLTKLIGATIPSLGLLVKATADTSRLDVLSSPHVMTLDNQKATISVGENIPYKTSNGGTTAAGGTLPANISREDVALSLEITPHVSDGDAIELDLSLEQKQLGDENFGGDLGPTWKERKIDTSVSLHDEESVVLGGLVDERIEDAHDGIPILDDLPIVGALFRHSKKVRRKSNLLVILTPHLVDDSAEGRAILERRMRERNEFLRATDDLETRVLQPDIDYVKKRGVIADIDATVEQVEVDKADLAAAAAKVKVQEGRIDGSNDR